MTTFSELSLAPALMKALTAQGYKTPTPIQARAIPLVKSGHDILGIAQTGTGKTAAFALPTIDYLIREYRDPPKRGGRVLVLAPTRELAQQIAASFRDYGKYMDISVACIFGGASVRGQIKAVVGGNDVLVATPGRLLDLVDQKALRLSEIEMLILDEADQMMDMGFIHALRKIVPLLPKERQTLFFSATMPKKIKQLADQFLTDPKTVSVAPAATTAERVEQQIYKCGKSEKQALLVTLLQSYDFNRALVFSRTKHGADRIVKKLAAAGVAAGALHGNKSQSQRQRILAAFKGGKTRVLVATDIAARGIDIDGITHVINYDLPNQPDQYVHRIGRTARAGRSGLAVSFCAPDEASYLKDIQKLIKQTLPIMPLPEDFNKKVAAVARLKPASPPKGEGGRHSPRNDPRKNREGREKKRRKGFKKKANAAQADIDSAITDGDTAARGARGKAPERRDVPEWKRKTKNPDGSRSARKKRKEANRGKGALAKAKPGQKSSAQGEQAQGQQGQGQAKAKGASYKGAPYKGKSKLKRSDYAKGAPKGGSQERSKSASEGAATGKPFKRKPKPNSRPRKDPTAGGSASGGSGSRGARGAAPRGARGGEAPPKRRKKS